MGMMVLWSPFYGKVNTFNRIFYFDWQFGLGLTNISTESNKNYVGVVGGADGYDFNENFVGLVYKTDFRFHVSRSSYLSFGVRSLNFQAAGPDQRSQKQWRDHWDFLVGYGYKF